VRDHISDGAAIATDHIPPFVLCNSPESYSEMPAQRATPAWKRHELISKAIFEVLLKQDNAENLDVKHNVTIRGVITEHQIDVLWSFRMGSFEHTVIVQVKKRKGRAKKSDLLLFHEVLRDIPSQPRGVFVSEHGYQKGALEVARATGIAALEIREISKVSRAATLL
jgi:hypothetical protein